MHINPVSLANFSTFRYEIQNSEHVKLYARLGNAFVYVSIKVFHQLWTPPLVVPPVSFSIQDG